ncbi:hypothetical protein [Pseudorhodoplanes sp.]|uniref:hypothetical protein n=1 Tax=Pseudorhodoplanes sp. TaxID=1934341 RepID=UPI00391DCAE9
MSVLELNRLCRETLRDHDFRKAMQTDPERAIARYRLTDEEKRALLAGDVVTLHRMGVNDFLMGYLARFNICGLNIPIYSERIRSAGPGGH